MSLCAATDYNPSRPNQVERQSTCEDYQELHYGEPCHGRGSRGIEMEADEEPEDDIRGSKED